MDGYKWKRMRVSEVVGVFGTLAMALFVRLLELFETFYFDPVLYSLD